MIRRILLSTVLAAPLAANAADLPKRTAPAPAPAFVAMNWSGAYAGVQMGVAQQRSNYASSDADWVSPNWVPSPVADIDNLKTNGFVGGVHAGYNYQMNSIVVGLEADVEGASGKNTYSVFEPASGVYSYDETWSASSRVKWQGSLRARMGFTVDRALLYVTGGLAFADVETVYASTINLPPASASNSASNMRTGYTLGAGVQYALTNAWSLRAEYRYTNLGTLSNSNTWLVGTTTTDPQAGPYSTTERHKLSSNTVRVGLSYAFGAK